MNEKLKRLSVSIIILLLGACAASTPSIQYDAATNPIEKMGLIKVQEPVAYMAMDWGQPAGIFGVGKMQEESEQYAELMRKAEFQLGNELYQALIKDLRAVGFKLFEATVAHEKPGELANPKAFAKSPHFDAYLDVVIFYAGYTTYNIFDRDFKPDLRVKVQLVSASDAKILFSEFFMYGYHNPFISATDLAAPETSYFKDFKSLIDDFDQSIDRLKDGARSVSATIADKLKN